MKKNYTIGSAGPGQRAARPGGRRSGGLRRRGVTTATNYD